MIVCKLNVDLLRSTSCGYSLPEIVEIYAANYEDLTKTPEISASEDGEDEITAITLANSAKFLKIEPAKNSASFEDTLVVEDNGTKYRTASVTFNVSGTYTKKLHAALDALSLGRYFVVVKTADGNYLGLGRISPLEAETATLAGGSDSNGMNIVLSGNIAESPMTLSEAAVKTVLGITA